MPCFPKGISSVFPVFLTLMVAASAARTGETRPNSLEPGSWSVQFQIDDNFQLTSFSGSAVSLKRHWSERRALRGGLSFGTDLNDYETAYTYPDTSYGDKSDLNWGSVSANLAYLIYPAPDREVLVYFGVGPLFSFSRSKRTYEGRDSNEYDRSWSAGLGGLIGVEWFATRSISLLAEYTGGFSYQSVLAKDYVNGRTRENNHQSISVSSSGVRFGLSAYF